MRLRTKHRLVFRRQVPIPVIQIEPEPSMTSPRLQATLAAAVLSALSLGLLSACGGGSSSASSATASSTTATASSTRVSTYITDNLTTEYAQVWVGIKTITAVDSTGAEVTLFTSADSSGYSTYDLRSLASVGELMSAASIPAAVYQQIKVTLAPDVKLVKASDSSMIDATFTSDGSDKVVRVSVTFDATTNNALVLDFNLDKFTYNASTNLVTADVSRKDSGTLRDFKFHQGEVRGAVVSVDTTANTITVNDARLGSATVLALATDAVITKESDGSTVALADLAVGTTIAARGTVTSTASDANVTVSVSAITIKSTSTSAAAANRYRGEGTISAISGTTVTLSLTEANFLPSSANLTLDVSTARYMHGQLSDLVAGGSLRFQASYNSTTDAYTANLVDVAGATAASKSSSATRPSKVEGTITAISGSLWTVSMTSSAYGIAAGTYTVDVSAAYIKGSSTCQAVGSTIEARGALSDTTLTARSVKVKSCASTGTTTSATTSTS